MMGSRSFILFLVLFGSGSLLAMETSSVQYRAVEAEETDSTEKRAEQPTASESKDHDAVDFSHSSYSIPGLSKFGSGAVLALLAGAFLGTTAYAGKLIIGLWRDSAQTAYKKSLFEGITSYDRDDTPVWFHNLRQHIFQVSKQHPGFGARWKVDPVKLHELLEHPDFEKLNGEQRDYLIFLLLEFTHSFFYNKLGSLLNEDQDHLLEKARENVRSLLEAENARFLSQDQKEKLGW